MDTYTQKRSLLDILYAAYMEGRSSVKSEAKAYFDQLDSIIGDLPLEENDRLNNLICDLCIFHERFAFIEGVRVGGALVREMSEQ